MKKKIKGQFIRSRVPHMEEYYTKLEKRQGEENMIFSLENEDGQLQEHKTNVLSFCPHFIKMSQR